MDGGMVETVPQSLIDLLIAKSEDVRGFTVGDEAVELIRRAYLLDPCRNVVEVGSFLGSSAILLAGAMCSGTLHCIDPFDGSGDEFSVLLYQQILASYGDQLECFWRNIDAVYLRPMIRVWRSRAEDVRWRLPIDMLYMDGDQSPKGARDAWSVFAPHLRSGAVVALHNSEPDNYREHHDGYRILAERELRVPYYREISLIGTTTFAVKV